MPASHLPPALRSIDHALEAAHPVMAAGGVDLKHGVDRPGGRRRDQGVENGNGGRSSGPDVYGRGGSIEEVDEQGTGTPLAFFPLLLFVSRLARTQYLNVWTSCHNGCLGLMPGCRWGATPRPHPVAPPHEHRLQQMELAVSISGQVSPPSSFFSSSAHLGPTCYLLFMLATEASETRIRRAMGRECGIPRGWNPSLEHT